MKYLLLFLLSLTSAPVFASPPPSSNNSEEIIQQSQSIKEYQVLGVSFTTPVEFSAPTEVGLDAQQLLYPATSQFGDETSRILLIRFSQEAQQNIQPEMTLLDYVKGVFLGIPNTKGKTRERNFKNQIIMGETITTNFPQNRRLEIYFINLLNNDQLAVVFESSSDISDEEIETIINSVAQSLTETSVNP